MGNRHHEPGGRAEDRRREFEHSRGLNGRRELPLDDEPAADESAADESAADESGADGPEAGDPDEVSSPAEHDADDQG
jgi:hypothetical protein